MIKKQTLFLAFLTLGVLFTNSALADTATSTEATITPSSILSPDPNSTSTPPSVLGLQTPSIPPIIQKIKDAKVKLSSVPLNHALVPIYKNVKDKKTGKTTKKLSSYQIGDKDIALAILDPSTGETTITVGRLNGKTMVFPDAAVDVKLTKFNGVNSKFEVARPAGGAVLALKYLISNPDSGSKAAIEKGLYEAMYVPYSADLSSPEVIAYGAEYLNNLINNVTQELQNLPSHAIPGKTITEAIPPAMIKALVYAEHTDTASVLYGNDTPGTINQLNILLASNEGDTYKYSVSTAGARGIAQFIPSTYKSLVQRRTDVSLIPDFVEGMSDHQNSIKAMYLLLDDYAGTVRVKGALGFVSSRVFEYGAASYNGGTTRVAKAVNIFGTSWNEDKSSLQTATQAQINNLTAQIKKEKDKKIKAALQSELASAKNQLNDLKTSTLRNETVNYLAKIYKVIQYFNEQQI